MRGLFLLVRSQLLRRRALSALVGLSLAASALLLSSALVMLHSFDRPFERMFEAQRGSHLVIGFDADLYAPAAIRSWWTQQTGVDRVTPPLVAVEIEQAPLVNGRELATKITVVERPRQGMAQDLLRIVSGQLADVPGPGEVWLPTAMAFAGDIQVGDQLEIPASHGLETLRVAALVVDPQFSNAFMNPTRVWVGPGELSLKFPANALGFCMLGIRLKDPATLAASWQAFADFLGGGFSGFSMQYETVAAANTAVAGFIGGLLLALAGVALLVSLLFVHASLASILLADYRQIGVLKAEGYTPRRVVAAYALYFGALVVLAAPLGIGAGLVLSQAVLAVLMRAISGDLVAPPVLAVSLLSAGLLVIAVFGTVATLGARIGRISAAQAIRFGGPNVVADRATGRRPLASAWPLPVLISVRILLRQSRRALFALVGVVSASFVLLFAINLVNSFAELGRRMPMWGYDGADVRVTRQGKRLHLDYDDLMRRLDAHRGVRAVAAVDYLVEGAVPRRGERASRTLFGIAVDGDFDQAGFVTASGRHPQGLGEVSLAVGTAREYSVESGQVFPLQIQGQRVDLTVSGVYQSVNNMGQGFRLHADTLRQVDPLYEPSAFAVMLEPGVERAATIAALEAELGELIDAEPGDRFVAAVVASLVRAMSAGLGGAAFIFLAVSLFFIASSTIIDLREHRLTMGVLKTAGMTPRELRLVMVTKAALLGCLGLGVGAGLWALATGPLLSAVFSGMGLISFPLSLHRVGSLAVAPLVIGLCCGVAWFASRAVVALDVRALVVE